MKQQLPGFEDMLFYMIGFHKGLNAEGRASFEGLEAIYYICESKKFFAILMNKISHFVTPFLEGMV